MYVFMYVRAHVDAYTVSVYEFVLYTSISIYSSDGDLQGQQAPVQVPVVPVAVQRVALYRCLKSPGSEDDLLP